ncbi:hypothetical protein BJX99DRAFT_261276 [Aspergillus californicus]
MGDQSVIRKDQLETSLLNEQKLINDGTINDDNPLDLSDPFRELCEACRKGDLKVCQEKITEGVNINARDQYDYTPLILASLCGHYEVAQLLLESGSLCERDTFQGERCLYNALNDRIRNLLLEYDYSKSTDPLQPLAAHTASLLVREQPKTSDIEVTAADETLYLHKFILAARSPYFHQELRLAPETTTWKLPSNIPSQAFGAAVKYLYLGEPPRDIRSGPGTGFTESEVFAGIDKVAKHLEISTLVNSILDSGDRRLARQRRSIDIRRGRDQLDEWFRENVLRNKIVVDTSKTSDIKWDHNNPIFADVLLQADELPGDVDLTEDIRPTGLPLGPIRSSDVNSESLKSVLFPCHRSMLLRSEFFQTMFNSPFREAHMKEHLHIIPVDCSPAVLEIVLTFLYTERADLPLDIAVDVLFAADMLFIEKLKAKAAVVISTLGNGDMSQAEAAKTRGKEEDDLDIYAILRAAWMTRVQRLEEFAARYLAYRLEAHIDSPDFAELIEESASRIQKRQETDSIELLDDIRFYLNERFRLRFDDAGIDQMMEGTAQPPTMNHDTIDEDIEKATNGVDTINLAVDKPTSSNDMNFPVLNEQDSVPVIRTLDGEIAGDEFDKNETNYQILMEKLDQILENLNLDA